MRSETKQALHKIRETLTEAARYDHAGSLLTFDMETICPPKAMEEQGDLVSFIENKAFSLRHTPEFEDQVRTLYQNREDLEDTDRILAESLFREMEKTKNISPEQALEFSKVYNKAYVDWIQAKNKSDFSLYVPSLKAVREADLKKQSLLEHPSPVVYDDLLDIYERGMTSGQLDVIFDACRERLVPLLRKILASKKKIRTDFTCRRVDEKSQETAARYLLQVIGYDFERGLLTTTEHPFTDTPGRDDVRVTTHYYPENFMSSMYSVIHEGGHALFDQNQPRAHWDHFITGEKTMGQHESVSRFYENRIGRSEAFISLVFPELKKIMPEALGDVSSRELYEAVNRVHPTLIRTEADEFTYTFHIMIRYEIEKMIVNGQAKIEDLPRIWNDKYEEYLGVRPANDREGVLQDVHWTFGFGYFPTYALGNFYNAMYYNQMAKEIDIDAAIRAGRFDLLNGWMRDHVFNIADRMAPSEWIRAITGRSLTPDDFLDYLESKYNALYEL